MVVRRARDRSEKGAVAVEFALIMPVLVTMLFGMVWTGLAYADHIAVNNAIREGARYGAAADASNANWATSVRDRVIQAYANGESSLTNAQICVRLVKPDGTDAVSAWSGASCGSAPSDWATTTIPAMATGSCVVEVWAAKPRTISLIIFPDLHVTIGGNSIAYYGRQVGACTASP
jgi:Flp pilus assembly protein TadG